MGHDNMAEWKKHHKYLKSGIQVSEASFPIYLQVEEPTDDQPFTLGTRIERIIVDFAHPSYLFKAKREWPCNAIHRFDITLNFGVYLSGACIGQLKLDHARSFFDNPLFKPGRQYPGQLEKIGMNNERQSLSESNIEV